MSDEIIRVKDAAYSKYEALLIRRDEVKKQAYLYEQDYIREFGDLILDVFRKKMETIRKKKIIEYCRIFLNRGECVDNEALQAYLAKELEEYKKQLDDMVESNKAAKSGREITEMEMLKIKRIYHRLVKKIHPDINPLTNENEKLRELWHRLIIAYNCNNLKEMEETEVLINKVLEELDVGTLEITIPDIDEKIIELEVEIAGITGTDPYQYKYLLADKEAVALKKEELGQELKEYEDYEKQLDEILSEMILEGVILT